MRRSICIPVLLALLTSGLTHAEITADDYARAERWVELSGESRKEYVKNLLPVVNWIGQSNDFWYARETEEGKRFTLVDAGSGAKRDAFDHEGIARALEGAKLSSGSADQLPFEDFRFLQDRTAIAFEIESHQVECELEGEISCRSEEKVLPEPGLLISPDGSRAVYTEGGNLHRLDLATGERSPLTEDGEVHNGYGIYYGNWKASHIARVRSGERQVPMETKWSPDSRMVLVTHLDERHVAEYPFVETVPNDATHRPKVYLPRIPLTGERPPALTWYIIHVDTGAKVFLNLPYEKLFHVHQDMTAIRKIWWSDEGTRLFALAWADNLSGAYLFDIDLETGEVRTVLGEHAEPRFDTNSTSYNPPNVEVLGDGEEIIWFSMRDGWGHLYLYDGVTGALKNRITQGDWLVRDIVKVDAEARLIYFTGSGREPGNPYYKYLYSIGFDGGEPRLLTPEPADHLITSPYNDVLSLGGAVAQEILSPSGEYLVYSYSTVSMPTRSVIRRLLDGEQIAEFERADASALYEAGWRDPEEIVLTAADGETDLYGLLYKPADFDPSKTYPIIDSQYASPLTAVVARNFSQVINPIPGRTPQMSLTELGFAVMVIDARGTTFRSRDFSHHSWQNLNIIGLDDHVAALEQLAAAYTWIDIDRVGIHGSSYGGFTTFRAMWEFPEVFKVGISNVGVGSLQHMYPDYHWEAFHGRAEYANGTRYYNEPTETPVNYQNNDSLLQAENLEGELLIMLGELDENVLPATTLQLVSKLIELDKDFDMVYVPNRNHYMRDPHLLRRYWDFFVEHLHGQQPPFYRMSRGD